MHLNLPVAFSLVHVGVSLRGETLSDIVPVDYESCCGWFVPHILILVRPPNMEQDCAHQPANTYERELCDRLLQRVKASKGEN